MFRSWWCAALCVALMPSGAFAQTTWKPERNIEILIGSTAGTGPDRVARIIERLWREQKLVEAPAAVVREVKKL